MTNDNLYGINVFHIVLFFIVFFAILILFMFLTPTSSCFTSNVTNLTVSQAFEGVELNWDGGIGAEQYVIYINNSPKVSKQDYMLRMLTNSKPHYEKLSAHIGSILYFKVSQIKTCNGNTQESRLSNEASIELLCGPEFNNLVPTPDLGDPINLVDITIPALPNNYPVVNSMDVQIAEDSDFISIIDSIALNSSQAANLPLNITLSTNGVSNDTLYIRSIVNVTGSSVICSTFGHPIISYVVP